MAEKKVKTKSFNLDDTNFLKTIKIYFSSISARTCTYLYFNITNDPSLLIMSNGDGRLVHKKKAMISKEAYHLSFHILRIKNKTVLENIYNLFNFTFDKPYIIDLKKALSIINKCIKEKEELKAIYDVNSNLLLTYASDVRDIDTLTTELKALVDEDFDESDDDDSDFDESDDDDDCDSCELDNSVLDNSYAVGYLFDEYRVHNEILTHVDYILSIEKNIYNPDFIKCYKKIDILDASKFRSSIYRYDFNLSDIKDHNGNIVYGENYRQQFTYVLHDGLDIPSIGEFIKKCDTRDWEKNLYLFVDKYNIFKFISIINHSYLDIISMRPFVGIMPFKIK